MTEQSEENSKELSKSPEEGAPQEPEAESVIPEEVREVLEKLPPEDQRIIRRTMSFSRMTYAGPIPNPVLSKVTSEHVSEIIRCTENENVREHQTQTSARRYTFLYFLITAIIIIGILVFLVLIDLRDLFLQILLVLGGVGAGFGLGRLRKSRD